ncbi:hypothetical protein Pfo_002992 [Paulownia fortunei]|nr:hypothetical protein Pfo_002992 [Paulownia fortunei]
MATSGLRSKPHLHVRSISFQSASHPVVTQFDEHLCRLRACEATPSSLSSISNKLSDIQNLYHNIHDLLLLPRIQHIISQECQEKWVDEILEGYIRLLDACGAAKDHLSHAKQEVQELLSALRRRDLDDFQGYLSCRRKSQKMIKNTLKDLSFKNKHKVQAESMAVLYMLKEAESVIQATPVFIVLHDRDKG